MGGDYRRYEICSQRKEGGSVVRHGGKQYTKAQLERQVRYLNHDEPERLWWVEEYQPDYFSKQAAPQG